MLGDHKAYGFAGSIIHRRHVFASWKAMKPLVSIYLSLVRPTRNFLSDILKRNTGLTFSCRTGFQKAATSKRRHEHISVPEGRRLFAKPRRLSSW
jgi:hypothetical protein